MRKNEFIVKYYQNVLVEGIIPREAFMLSAVAQLTGGEEGRECTSLEVSKLTGDSHLTITLRRMTWWLNIREVKNERNMKTFYFSMKHEGILKLERLLA